jgi:hypothetical protein
MAPELLQERFYEFFILFYFFLVGHIHSSVICGALVLPCIEFCCLNVILSDDDRYIFMYI